MEKMVILYFLFLCFGSVAGFLVQNESVAHTSDDRTIQNLLNLIVNEQNSRLQLQNLVSTMSLKIDQLENTVDQMRTDSELKINQTKNEMVKKVNEMSARLVQMEQVNAEVSRQVEKEKNNREHLEKMYTNLDKRVSNFTVDCGTRSEISHIKSTLNNLTSMLTTTRGNLTDVYMKLEDLKHQYEGANVDYKATDIKLYNLSQSNIDVHDKLVVIESKLSNSTVNENIINMQLKKMSEENIVLKELIENVTSSVGLSRSHETVGFSVYSADTSSGSSSGDSLKYLKLICNSGNGYDMSTGVFTCTYPGLYFFTSTMFRIKNVRESSCSFYVNNHAYSLVSSGAYLEEGYMSGSQSVVIMLKVGDRVHLSNCGSTDHLNFVSSFSGFLISS